MSNRTDSEKVKDILQGNYDSDANPSLQRFITAANVIVTRTAVCASKRGVALAADELLEMEAWLAAYFYCKGDPTYKSRSTQAASGAFNTDPDDFKNQAIQLDPSGCLNAQLNKLRARAVWLGKPVSSQIPYDERD
jgi:hypothetical protein